MLAFNSVVILWITSWSVTWTQAYVENEIFRNWFEFTGGYVEHDAGSHLTSQSNFDTILENQPVPLAPYPVTLLDPDLRPEHQPELVLLPDEAPSQQVSTYNEPSSTLSIEISTLSTSSDGSTEVEVEDYLEAEPFTESAADTNSKNEGSCVKFMEITTIVGCVLVAVISLVILFIIIYVFCPLNKAQEKYSVKLCDLSKNNTEPLQIYTHRDMELEMGEIDLN